MNAEEYKEYHEARMANNVGTSPVEIEIILTNLLFSIILSAWLRLRANITQKYLSFVLDFFAVVVPITLEVSLMSESIYVIPLNMLLMVIAIVMTRVDGCDFKRVLGETVPDRKGCITNYRGITNLISVLCILAVDFSSFPERLAKTETYGFGLMDVGVGHFVCSNGIVSRNAISRSEFRKVIASSLTLIFLGCARLASVKSINYHEHASEYGVHWNFFFTLAFCKLVSYLFLVGSYSKKPLFLAVFAGAIHQLLLMSGLQAWVLSDVPRDSFLSANREGISSILGYVSLYFASASLGQVVNTKNGQMTYRKLLSSLFIISVVTWACTGACYLTIGISRRLMNPGYNFWLIASTSMGFFRLLIGDMLIICMQRSEKNGKTIKTPITSLVLDSINSNGLFYFLFSNLLTGIINISFQTLLLDSLASFSILLAYMMTTCGVCYELHCRKFFVKIW